MKNDGTAAQDDFVSMMEERYGKNVYIYRLTDTKEIKGALKQGFVKKTPSDYIVTANGKMIYAEVKSTIDPKKFSFKFQKGQHIAMLRQTNAGGDYMVFINSLHHKCWYMVPAEFFLANEKKSATWKELECFILTSW